MSDFAKYLQHSVILMPTPGLVCWQDKHVDTFSDKVGGYLNSVVGILLRHNKAAIRTLGARLLAQFEKVQVLS